MHSIIIFLVVLFGSSPPLKSTGKYSKRQIDNLIIIDTKTKKEKRKRKNELKLYANVNRGQLINAHVPYK